MKKKREKILLPKMGRNKKKRSLLNVKPNENINWHFHHLRIIIFPRKLPPVLVSHVKMPQVSHTIFGTTKMSARFAHK